MAIPRLGGLVTDTAGRRHLLFTKIGRSTSAAPTETALNASTLDQTRFDSPYLPTNDDDVAAMLDTIGVSSLEDLLTQIPDDVRLTDRLDVPEALSEWELQNHVSRLAAKNVGTSSRVCFTGGGAYDHFCPAAVDEIASRGEWYTAYTPYQAEASQGTLQAIFEFQTLISRLTGMEVANASLYEQSTGVVEAVALAMRETRRNSRVVVSSTLHPHTLETLRTYMAPMACELVILDAGFGQTDAQTVRDAVDEHTAAVVFQSPNFFGGLEPGDAICDAAHDRGALAIAVVNPISLGVVRRPGDYGADIVVSEGQPLGVPLGYGGPYLGIFACRQKYVRKMPGRLVSQTTDRDGRPCYVLGLQTREQHIRRDKATSNICSNQGLIALRATVWLSLHGPNGLRELAGRSCQLAHYAAEQLTTGTGLKLADDGPFFNEFALVGNDLEKVQSNARDAGFDLGPRLKSIDPTAQQDALLVAVTEQRTREEIDSLAAALR